MTEAHEVVDRSAPTRDSGVRRGYGPPMTLRQPRIAIIGAGMSGICTGAVLRRAGIDDITVFEKADRVGGTWRENTYPGIACDVPSRFYQFTFAPNPEWTHLMSPGAEIWAYFTKVADDAGITARTRFGTEVTEARWTGTAWSVSADDGTVGEYDFVISATGILHHPSYPDIAGLDTFAGPAFHSARWDHDVDLRGKRVGLIGTGSTGVQILGELAGTVPEVLLFQRTPHWVVHLDNPEFSRFTRALHRRFPAYDRFSYHVSRRVIESLSPALLHPGKARRFLAWHTRRQLRRVTDPALRRALTPDSEPMCRRLIVSPTYYDAVQRDDVTVVTDQITSVEPTGVRTEDGVLHPCDVLVLATGFDAHAYLRPMNLIGPDGYTLAEAWAAGPRAYQTVALPGFPNFFLLMGPNSPVGNYSLTAIAETQAQYALGWVRRWQRGEIDTAMPTAAATDAFYTEVEQALPDTVWATGCTSWYLGPNGKPELFPWAPERHRELLGTVRTEDFTIT
ncbi:MAG: putative monooxygenase [Marmoricola sp.]|nr:putative monooxygenase [Marmoricola sp.]